MNKNSLKDTTYRSVLFGKPTVEVVPNTEGQMVLKEQVDSTQFDTYIAFLTTMAQLSRLIYCDSGILREAILSPAFTTNAMNDKITEIDNKYSSIRREPSTYKNSKEGRPNKSYVITESSQTGNGFARYVSTPSDLTFVAVTGSKVKGLNPTDLVISFKGSSTMKNFKHDLYSQFTAADLGKIMPPGTSMSSTTTNNLVPASFINPITKNWNVIKKVITDYNPTRLFITGHSLGGAYATLFGFIMAEIKAVSFPTIQTIHIVSFGCPTVVGDGARNTFNAHLDSGKLTLDRVMSYGKISRVLDIIPSIPVGFSHPGFQPLRTELFPEKKTGRAYNIETIRKVFQKGGILGFGDAKNKYETDTKVHMPNKIMVPIKNPILQAFPHGEYMDMTWISSFRLFGMKNPGFRGSDKIPNVFVADLFEDGIRFEYVPGDATEVAAEEPTDKTEKPITELSGAAPSSGSGRRRTIRKRISKTRRSKTDL